MSINKTRMQEGAVVFLDALGIKGIWARAEPETVVNSWEEVLDYFDMSIRKVKDGTKDATGDVCKDCHIAAFSDTVIVTLPCEDPGRVIPFMAEIIMQPFFAGLLKGIYFRGVISIGKFYQSQKLIIGPAIDEAAEWYTRPDWMGVSTAPSASFGIEMIVEQGVDISNWFVKYNIPTKSGIEENGWALAWPKRVDQAIKRLDQKKPIDHKITNRMGILNAFASRPISISADSKYKNTLSFFDFVTGLSNKGSNR